MDEKEKNSPSAAAPDQEEEKQPPSPPHTKEDPIGDILRQAALQEDKEALRGDYGPAVQFIIHGNYVSNSGTIYGGINQQQAASQNQALAVAEDTRTRVERFFSEESTYALAALITLASLQIVPESIFHEAVQDLCVRLARAKSGEDQGLPDRFLTAEQLLQPFLLQRQTAVLSYGSIQVDLRCLAFQQEDLSTEIRQQIWQNYSQIRPLLIEWLFALRSWTSDAARRTVSYTAMQCLASYAAFDLAYARGKILPFWEQHCTAQSDVKYLVVFLGQFMQWSPAKPWQTTCCADGAGGGACCGRWPTASTARQGTGSSSGWCRRRCKERSRPTSPPAGRPDGTGRTAAGCSFPPTKMQRQRSCWRSNWGGFSRLPKTAWTAATGRSTSSPSSAGTI